MTTGAPLTRVVMLSALACIVLTVACGGAATRTGRAPAAGAPTTVAASPTATPRAASATASNPATATAASRGLRIEAMLQPRSPVEAGVRVEAPTASAPADVTVTARIPRPGSYPVHLHSGSCRTPGATTGFLGALTPGGEGQATLRVASPALPGTATALTFELIDKNELIIDIHDPSGAIVACAEFARGGQQ